MCVYVCMKVPKLIIASVRRIDNNELCYIYPERKRRRKKLEIFASKKNCVLSRTCNYWLRHEFATTRILKSFFHSSYIISVVLSILTRTIEECIIISSMMHKVYLITALIYTKCRREDIFSILLYSHFSGSAVFL